jgi:hypothetical protein
MIVLRRTWSEWFLTLNIGTIELLNGYFLYLLAISSKNPSFSNS